MEGAVIGSYRLSRLLGKGGMGEVYLAHHTLLGRRAAVKVLLPSMSAQPEAVARFFNEARAVTSISDPGIVQVFDFGFHHDGRAYLVMEYLEGEALDRRLGRERTLDVREALRLGRQLASSLAAAHAQHIVHRDLKPENIYLVPDSEVAGGERSKILDFGIAKLADSDASKTATGTLIGTPTYMSPEQCRGVSDIDHRSDVYALGCVLFRMLVGRVPFTGEGPGDILSAHIREAPPLPSTYRADVTAEIDAFVNKCLAKLPSDRFSSMTAVTVAIGGILRELEAGPTAVETPSETTTDVEQAPELPATTTLRVSSGQRVRTKWERPRVRRSRWPIGAVLVVTIAAGLGAVIRERETTSVVHAAYSVVTPPVPQRTPDLPPPGPHGIAPPPADVQPPQPLPPVPPLSDESRVRPKKPPSPAVPDSHAPKAFPPRHKPRNEKLSDTCDEKEFKRICDDPNKSAAQVAAVLDAIDPCNATHPEKDFQKYRVPCQN